MRPLYQERIMDHYHHPRNKGRLERPDFTSEQLNPSCGDSILFDATVRTNKVIDKLLFVGQGCAISQAAASMLTEQCIGISLDAILSMNVDCVLSSIGMPLGPTRVRCALLPLQALQQGIVDYKNKRTNS